MKHKSTSCASVETTANIIVEGPILTTLSLGKKKLQKEEKIRKAGLESRLARKVWCSRKVALVGTLDTSAG